jgi:hypothetical protein
MVKSRIILIANLQNLQNLREVYWIMLYPSYIKKWFIIRRIYVEKHKKKRRFVEKFNLFLLASWIL